MITLGEQLNSALADFKDPFKSECVESVYIEIHPNRTFDKPIQARVYFKNGNTGGTQYFKGDTLPVVCKQMNDFIQGLEQV